MTGPIESEKKTPDITSLWRDVKEGFTFLWGRYDLRGIAAISFLANFGMGMVLSTLVFYLKDVLRADSLQIGLTFASVGIFGLAGSLVTETLTKFVQKGRLIAFLLLGGGSTGAVLIALVPHWVATAAGFGIWGGSITVIVTLLNTYKQETIDNQIFGRTEGALTALSYIALPLAGLLGGFAISEWDSMTAYLLAGVFVVSAGFVHVFSGLRKL